MKKTNWKSYVFFILIAVAGGAFMGLINADAIKDFNSNAVKPYLTPPEIVFPIAWTILYAMMGLSAAMIYNTDSGRENLFSYWLQLVFNYIWTFLFFGFKAYVFSLILLIVIIFLVAVTILIFWKINKKASYLLIPYFLWLIFAAYLNLGVWLLNRS